MEYIGKTLEGRYLLKKMIGSGGMANVFEAVDLQENNRPVAVKILRPELLTNEEFVRRFRNESRVIAVLDHPNIVKIYDVNFTGEDQYIVMEYIDGVTLNQSSGTSSLEGFGSFSDPDSACPSARTRSRRHSPGYQVPEHHASAGWLDQGHGFRDRPFCTRGYPERSE